MVTLDSRKIFVIAGPTAVGKSEIAVEVAVRLGAEIVNADSLQMLTGLDILTAKPAKLARAQIPHHLFGSIQEHQNLNAARYVELATRVWTEIRIRDGVILIVGGTGLYIQALLHGLSLSPPSQNCLRSDLARQSLLSLNRLLRSLHAETASNIDNQNKRRTERNLETAISGGRFRADCKSRWPAPPAEVNGLDDSPGVVLVCNQRELGARIGKRIDGMFRSGVVDEFVAWREQRPNNSVSRAIGYEHLESLANGEITINKCKRAIRSSTTDYAKRQVTWFRKYSGLNRIDVTDHSRLKHIVEQITQAIIVRRRRSDY